MPRCTCTPHFSARPGENQGLVAVTHLKLIDRIFKPGCPVHTPPGEDDYYSSETPPVPYPSPPR